MIMRIDSYSDDGVWIKITYFEMMKNGPEKTYEELVQLTRGLELVQQFDDDEEACKYALFA
jgi:hypothetical protein